MTKEEDEIAMRNGEISLAIERGAKEEKINIAKNMLREGTDIDFIAKVTNLSIEEIKKI